MRQGAFRGLKGWLGAACMAALLCGTWNVLAADAPRPVKLNTTADHSKFK